MVKGTEDDALKGLIFFLEKSAKKNNAPIWADVACYLSTVRRRRAEVNLGKLAKVTAEDEVVLVPGKLLGSGTLKHRLKVACWSMSRGVREKVEKAGGKAFTLRELVESNPSGNGVKIIL